VSIKVQRNVVTVASLVIAALVIAGFIGNYTLTRFAIEHAQRNWCVALDLLHRQLPPAVPLRTVLDQVARRFGC
jgi:hypothetical protein